MLDERDLANRVDELLNRRAAVGLAVGVMRDGSLAFFAGRGFADLGTRNPVTPDTIFRIASITKTFTAIAAMQLWERGLIDLDAPANDSLRAYRLVPADPSWRPATVRHLLTHTAGVSEVAHAIEAFRPDAGQSVPAGHPIPALAEFYRGGLRVEAEPGTRFRYSDHGFATGGQLVEDVNGQPLASYLREHVFEPLGMTDTTLDRADVDATRLATGYTITPRGAAVAPSRDYVTAGAASAFTTTRDMARYLAALTGGGRNEHGSVLQPATLAMMFDAQYRPDPRLPGIGFSFFRVDVGGHRAVEHAGMIAGFDSHVIVAPDDGVGVMAFTNGSADAVQWMSTETRRLLAEVLGAPRAAIRTDVPQHPEVWAELCGRYRVRGPVTDVRMKAMVGAGIEVFASGGRLRLRFLTPIPPIYRGFVLHPDDPGDPYAFRMEFGVSEDSSPVRVVFARDPATTAMVVHLELMFLSAEQRHGVQHPRRWALAMAGAAATALLIGRRLVRRRRH
ncbi:serine hydrolase domain-containing protein [Agromyces bauzanensis]